MPTYNVSNKRGKSKIKISDKREAANEQNNRQLQRGSGCKDGGDPGVDSSWIRRDLQGTSKRGRTIGGQGACPRV